MFTSLEQFKQEWQMESQATQKILAAITDPSLTHAVADAHRTISRVAWHIVLTIPEMIARTGLQIETIDEHTPPPTSAAEILDTYKKVSQLLLDKILGQWSDETLNVEDDMYGSKWKRGTTLWILIKHEIHHRAQLTVLMRSANLKVPGVYGPAKEEWTSYGMPEPAI